jgi:hypothetical protein
VRLASEQPAVRLRLQRDIARNLTFELPEFLECPRVLGFVTRLRDLGAADHRRDVPKAGSGTSVGLGHGAGFYTGECAA